MKKFFDIIKNDKIILWGGAISLVLVFISFLYIMIFYPRLPPLFPLFNQMPWGETRLGVKEQIFIPLFIASVIIVGNFLFASFVYEKIPLISRILSVTTLLVSFFTFLFILRTIQLIV